MIIRKKTVEHGAQHSSFRLKRRDYMPWWLWVLLCLAGIIGFAVWFLNNNRISRTPHSSKAQSFSNYISDDEIQAIKIIRELSRMYDEVDKRKARKK